MTHMTVEHSIEQVSVGQDGKSILLRDTSTGYGLPGMPNREDLAWLVRVTRHDGQAEELIHNIDYLRNASISEEPEYVVADAMTATHLHVALPDDGLYTLESVLVPRLQRLTPEQGNLALNLLFYNEQDQRLQRVTGTAQELEAGEPTGAYTYTLTDVPGVETAVAEGYPALTYPVLSVFEAWRFADRANLAYLEEAQQPVCGTQTGRSACAAGSEAYARRRELYFKLAYYLKGAEAALKADLPDRVMRCLVNTRVVMQEISDFDNC